MDSGPSTRVRRAWAAVSAAFPLVEPDPADPVTLDRLCADLVGLFSGLLAVDVRDRLDLPADYRRFLELAGGHRRRGDDYGTHLYGVSAVWANTEYDCRLFAEERPADAAIWLTIGAWSDKHVYALCCDRADDRFGHVVDGHDDHPWLDGGAVSRRADSFTAFLESLA